MSTMSQRSHLTDSEAWRVVGRLEGGQTQAEVAQAIEVSQSVISKIWNRFMETESAGRRLGQGRRRATTPNEDNYLVLTARRHRNVNATHLQQHLRSATGTTVSTQTVRNQVHGVGLYAHRPTSRFSVHPDNRRIFIWRDRSSRNNLAFVHERVRFGGGGVLVYGGISIDGRTDLYIIRDGPLTARRYRDEILRPIVVPYAAAIGDDFEEGIVRMEWPACSPDMNPIEHVCDSLGRRVAGPQPPLQTLQVLERALLEEWDRIPQLVNYSFIDSMPQRKLTVRCALWAGGIIGPYFFKNDEDHNVTVNGDRYKAMITNFFIPELNNHDVQELWFQQDGATCHTARATIDLLKDTFGDRLISRFGPVN
ncbi:transposable element Tcb2 transposase [Trichonephila clavipes]|nr:transposable element Tcb2 transposase [Trichonephila clavipes]